MLGLGFLSDLFEVQRDFPLLEVDFFEKYRLFLHYLYRSNSFLVSFSTILESG